MTYFEIVCEEMDAFVAEYKTATKAMNFAARYSADHGWKPEDGDQRAWAWADMQKRFTAAIPSHFEQEVAETLARARLRAESDKVRRQVQTNELRRAHDKRLNQARTVSRLIH